ncbi:hypothetical protein ZIOFF_028354 [Zingiber officinale]|uniref:Uncharacterized protein n=1 Tax=Zingiber officinale TaxID=94328 RepID=A0A8J5L8X8_ZINOF|nr:hypothetical protein ZIOFF_028354 [Zingiber officinale]
MAASLQSAVFLSNRIDLHRRLFASPARSLPGTKGSILVVRSDGRISGRLSGRNLITNAIAVECCFADTPTSSIDSKPGKNMRRIRFLAPALLSASDKLKIEVIEDMSIQVNVPALAMEEVAPLAVSDAAMLAPEEIFHGKGNIKEEAELTKEEKKRRRANQKRRFRRLKAATPSSGHYRPKVSVSGSDSIAGYTDLGEP